MVRPPHPAWAAVVTGTPTAEPNSGKSESHTTVTGSHGSSSQTSKIKDVFAISPHNHAGIKLVGAQFNGSNYYAWSRAVRRALAARNKLPFIDDGKGSEKANAVRSKHSVTEQRRRSKINERFQILRVLIPHIDQKRDTASFLLEVIQYVQFLQEKVQKYEGSYQSWNSEPTKLMPWRNNHWRAQNLTGQPQTTKNGSSPGSTFPGRFDENSAAVPIAMQPSQPSPAEPDHIRDSPGRPIDPLTELPNRSMSMPSLPIPVPMASDGGFSHALHGPPPPDLLSTECPSTSDGLNHQDEPTIEGGTISVSSVYSEGLLHALTQALHSTAVDLSRASISVQINLGKQANIEATPSTAKDHIIPMPPSNQPVGTYQDATSSEDLDLAQKRRKL